MQVKWGETLFSSFGGGEESQESQGGRAILMRYIEKRLPSSEIQDRSVLTALGSNIYLDLLETVGRGDQRRVYRDFSRLPYKISILGSDRVVSKSSRIE